MQIKKEVIWLIRLFVWVMVLIVIVSANVKCFAQDRDFIEARKCAKVLSNLVTHLKMGGSNEGAKQYFNMPPKDFLGTTIPFDKFMDVIRMQNRQGFEIIGFDVFDYNIVRITYCNPKVYNEYRAKGKTPQSAMRFWFQTNKSGYWKISGIWYYEGGEFEDYLKYYQYRSYP